VCVWRKNGNSAAPFDNDLSQLPVTEIDRWTTHGDDDLATTRPRASWWVRARGRGGRVPRRMGGKIRDCKIRGLFPEGRSKKMFGDDVRCCAHIAILRTPLHFPCRHTPHPRLASQPVDEYCSWGCWNCLPHCLFRCRGTRTILRGLRHWIRIEDDTGSSLGVARIGEELDSDDNMMVDEPGPTCRAAFGPHARAPSKNNGTIASHRIVRK
jgi:hypothetical protein